MNTDDFLAGIRAMYETGGNTVRDDMFPTFAIGWLLSTIDGLMSDSETRRDAQAQTIRDLEAKGRAVRIGRAA